MDGTQNEHLVKLLWTGGWDSTFRLLSLVLLEKRAVQPFYLIEHERRSSLNELAAMDTIRRKTIEKVPMAAELLLPTRVFLVSEIEPCPEITKRFKSLSSRFRVGSQFEWLPRFAVQHQRNDLELAIEKNELRPREPVFAYLGEFLTQSNGVPRMAENVADQDMLIFQYFRFPLYYMTKLEMLSVAEEHGFRDIMLDSWFCHHPRRGEPCGTCHPCIDAMEEGFSFRLPRSSYIRYRANKVLQSLKEALPAKQLIRRIIGRR